MVKEWKLTQRRCGLSGKVENWCCCKAENEAGIEERGARRRMGFGLVSREGPFAVHGSAGRWWFSVGHTIFKFTLPLVWIAFGPN